MPSACGSGCCFVRCTPSLPPHALSAPQREAYGGQSGTNLGPVHMSSCAIVCNRPSLSFQEYFARDCIHISYVTPQCPSDTPYTTCWPLTHQYRHLVVKSGSTAGQHNMSSACGSGCCFVTCTHPSMSPQCLPERHLVAKSGSNLGPVHVSPCAIVCNRLSLSFQEYFARDYSCFIYKPPMPLTSLIPPGDPW